MNIWFFATAAVADGIAALHVTVGGRSIARPLLVSRDLDALAERNNDDGWRLVTITLLALTATLLWAGIAAAAWPPGVTAI